MKHLPVFVAALCIALLAFGCKPVSGPIDSTFIVDGVSATLGGGNLEITMSHHGTAHQGLDGWQFQALIDADGSAATGLAGADYMVNGVEAPTLAGYAVHPYDSRTSGWGPAVTHAGRDDGQLLDVVVSQALIPPTGAASKVTLVGFLRGQRVFVKTVAVASASVARG